MSLRPILSIWRCVYLWEHCANTLQTVACKSFQCFAQLCFLSFGLIKLTWGICHCSTTKVLGREGASQGCISLCSYLLVRYRGFTYLCSLDIYTVTSTAILGRHLHNFRLPKEEQKEIIAHKTVYIVNMLKGKLLFLSLYSIACCSWDV